MSKETIVYVIVYVGGQIALMFLLLGVVLIAHQNPIPNVESFLNVTLTASTVIFGFLTLNMTRQLEEFRKQKQDISDLGAELLKLLDKVRKHKELSKKTVHWSTNSLQGSYGGSDTAESAIVSAYDYVTMNIWSMVQSQRLLVLTLGAPALLFLLSSIVLSVLSRIITVESETVGGLGLISILLGMIFAIINWVVSSRMFEENSNRLICIRQSILKDLYRRNSSAVIA